VGTPLTGTQRPLRFEHDGRGAACSSLRRPLRTAAGRPARRYRARSTVALGASLTISEIEAGHMLYIDALDETGTLVSDWLAA